MRRFTLILTILALAAGCRLFLLAGPEKPSGPEYEGFVLVRGGTFQMGDLWGDGSFAMRELPVHEAQVDNFLIARHEVTVAQFARFAEATGHKTVAEADAGLHPSQAVVREGKKFYPSWRKHWFEQGPDHPVVLIAWEDAIAYCNWLSREHGLPPAYDEKTGRLLDSSGQPTPQIRRVRGFRLPTEAEWEFAARERGRKVRFGNGQDVARASEMNFDAAGAGQAVPSLRLRGNLNPYNEPGPYLEKTTPVGSFRPNALGLHDMSGNAWEWCSDTGGSDYTAEKRVNPVAQGGRGHMLRGGTYDTDAKACRTSARIDWHERAWCSASGFRVSLTVE
jgi:formylglycine-generating enzyme required for sulfatase activity